MNPIIEIDRLSRHYGEKAALDQISLRLEGGKVLGLIGENGAGKTTLIKHVLGLLRAEEGSVRVFGMDPVTSPASVLSRIGYLAEEDWLPAWMRVSELQRYYQGFYPKWDQGYAEELRERFGIDRRATIGSLSKGQRARVGLMAALAYRPELLLLDEPSSGLDPIVRREILATIIRAIADDQRTVLFSSHLLGEIEQVADEVAMIKDGRILFCDTLEAIQDAHLQVTLRFDVDLGGPPTLTGAMRWEGRASEWSCVYTGKEPIEAVATTLHATLVERRGMTLDEIFVARTEATFSC